MIFCNFQQTKTTMNGQQAADVRSNRYRSLPTLAGTYRMGDQPQTSFPSDAVKAVRVEDMEAALILSRCVVSDCEAAVQNLIGARGDLRKSHRCERIIQPIKLLWAWQEMQGIGWSCFEKWCIMIASMASILSVAVARKGHCRRAVCGRGTPALLGGTLAGSYWIASYLQRNHLGQWSCRVRTVRKEICRNGHDVLLSQSTAHRLLRAPTPLRASISPRLLPEVLLQTTLACIGS
jgi:hypothetical protein